MMGLARTICHERLAMSYPPSFDRRLDWTVYTIPAQAAIAIAAIAMRTTVVTVSMSSAIDK
jgi:hypothetical protein